MLRSWQNLAVTVPWPVAAAAAFKNTLTSSRILQYVDRLQGNYNVENEEGEAAAAGTKHKDKTPACGYHSKYRPPASHTDGLKPQTSRSNAHS